MSKFSMDTAPQVEDFGPMVGRYGELEGYTVGFEYAREDIDGTEFFKGLPDDRCQCSHWGYVISGRVTVRFEDHEEVYEAGDAYFTPPGHIPFVEAGTETVEFTPVEEYRQTMAMVEKNLAAMTTN